MNFTRCAVAAALLCLAIPTSFSQVQEPVSAFFDALECAGHDRACRTEAIDLYWASAGVVGDNGLEGVALNDSSSVTLSPGELVQHFIDNGRHLLFVPGRKMVMVPQGSVSLERGPGVLGLPVYAFRRDMLIGKARDEGWSVEDGGNMTGIFAQRPSPGFDVLVTWDDDDRPAEVIVDTGTSYGGSVSARQLWRVAREHYGKPQKRKGGHSGVPRYAMWREPPVIVYLQSSDDNGGQGALHYVFAWPD